MRSKDLTVTGLECESDRNNKSLLGRRRNREREKIANFSISLCLLSLVSDCSEVWDTGSCTDIEVSQVMKASGETSKTNKKEVLIYMHQWLLHYCLFQTGCRGVFEGMCTTNSIGTEMSDSSKEVEVKLDKMVVIKINVWNTGFGNEKGLKRGKKSMYVLCVSG